MNIFSSDPCPIVCAEALDNKRVVKMVLESAQMLSSAVFIHTKTVTEPLYKPTHLGHPCVLWSANSSENFAWLFQHFEALCAEYTFRYGKTHACEKLRAAFIEHCAVVPAGPRTPFPCCMPDEHKIGDVHENYKSYLASKWKNDVRPPVWTRRAPPL